jgi:hypothetical protein
MTRNEHDKLKRLCKTPAQLHFFFTGNWDEFNRFCKTPGAIALLFTFRFMLFCGTKASITAPDRRLTQCRGLRSRSRDLASEALDTNLTAARL